MNEREFCFWLKGFFEIQGTPPKGQIASGVYMSGEQIEAVRKNLDEVFRTKPVGRSDCAASNGIRLLNH